MMSLLTQKEDYGKIVYNINDLKKKDKRKIRTINVRETTGGRKNFSI